MNNNFHDAWVGSVRIGGISTHHQKTCTKLKENDLSFNLKKKEKIRFFSGEKKISTEKFIWTWNNSWIFAIFTQIVDELQSLCMQLNCMTLQMAINHPGQLQCAKNASLWLRFYLKKADTHIHDEENGENPCNDRSKGNRQNGQHTHMHREGDTTRQTEKFMLSAPIHAEQRRVAQNHWKFMLYKERAVQFLYDHHIDILRLYESVHWALCVCIGVDSFHLLLFRISFCSWLQVMCVVRKRWTHTQRHSGTVWTRCVCAYMCRCTFAKANAYACPCVSCEPQLQW